MAQEKRKVLVEMQVHGTRKGMEWNSDSASLER